MDRPPGGWSDLVTNQVIDAKLAALEHQLMALEGRLVATLERGFRIQTWRLAVALLATVTVMTAILRVT